jgi:hypothetical protein
MGILLTIFRFLNRDLSGKSWAREKSHPYFGKMTFYGYKDPSKNYWEAQVPLPDGSGNVGVTMQGTLEGPTEREEQFCRALLTDLNPLFARCRAAFEPVFLSWVKQPLPLRWQEAFKLDGFQIPKSGSDSGSWEVTYYVEPAGHWFTAVFDHGAAVRTDVDG